MDLETTGLDLRKDSIASFGVVMIDGGSTRCSLAQPDCALSVESIGVHCLRDVDLLDAPSQDDVAGAGRARGLGVSAFLDRLLRKVNCRLGGVILDTAALARAAGFNARTSGGEPSLEGLANKLGLPVHTPHHALGDAMTHGCGVRGPHVETGPRTEGGHG